ncbi:MAG: rod shape-determining protein MreC [Drouetiella hepatica Uher 2000/2452]|jgi:rod shape-determining protein MreC|uniref:Cell shape-determining protein MreC n=1 Tax=Drouetiella hepatica Uher 2000/2452 TaxID=904376 RepID=A0A951QCA1_9CYAN|nr:rod shape-determining protein MreC [Drouetiella hepatica Uher 2000/2452]
MYTLRRWWDRNGIRLGLVVAVVICSWAVRQTQGAAIFELYQLLARPFTGLPTSAEQTIDPRTLELEQRIAELQSQNQQLQELVGYTAKQPSNGIAAPVIGRSPDHWWQQTILGRGKKDGIQVGSIATSGGIVGRITEVTDHSSRVLLISDPTSQVGVTITRSRYMGYVRGQGANRVIMEFFDKVPDVRPGDVVTTSSISRRFPPGLPIGTVESVNLNKSPAPEAVIELSAPISHLEWVMVYSTPQAAADPSNLSAEDDLQDTNALSEPSVPQSDDSNQPRGNGF